MVLLIKLNLCVTFAEKKNWCAQRLAKLLSFYSFTPFEVDKFNTIFHDLSLRLKQIDQFCMIVLKLFHIAPMCAFIVYLWGTYIYNQRSDRTEYFDITCLFIITLIWCSGFKKVHFWCSLTLWTKVWKQALRFYCVGEFHSYHFGR